MKMSRRGTAGAVALTMVILLAGCSAPDIPGDETDGKTGVPNDVAADVGVDWELAETGFDEGSEVRSIATGAGRVWVEVFVEGAGCDELQLWWSADALTWQREDLAAAGIPEEALCNLGVSSFAPGPTEMSGDDDTFTFGLFLDEPMLDLLGISYTTHVRGAEWVLRFDGEIWSSHGLPGNGLLERQTLPGYWDGASTPRDSATVNGATMFVTTGGWFQEGRTTGETFHARYVDSEGVGSVIQSLGEPFLAADGEFRRSDFVTHNGTEWIVVGELGVGLDGIAVWSSPDAREWTPPRIPGPGNDALYSIDALAHGDVGTIISGTVDPDSYEEPHRAFVLLSTDGREFEVIELPTPVGAAADVDVNEVSWVGDRYVAVGTYSTDIFLQQSFDGRVWTEIGVPDLRRPRGEIVRWGTGWVGYFGGLVLLTGLAAS